MKDNRWKYILYYLIEINHIFFFSMKSWNSFIFHNWFSNEATIITIIHDCCSIVDLWWKTKLADCLSDIGWMRTRFIFDFIFLFSSYFFSRTNLTKSSILTFNTNCLGLKKEQEKKNKKRNNNKMNRLNIKGLLNTLENQRIHWIHWKKCSIAVIL